MRTIWRAGRWMGEPGNRDLVSDILAAPGRLPIAAEVIDRALTGRLIINAAGEVRHTDHLITFHKGAASFPWKSQAAWIATRLAARHGLDPAAAARAAAASFRTDLYRLHLGAAGADLPSQDSKIEGAQAAPGPVATDRGNVILLADPFFDRRIFDPSEILR